MTATEGLFAYACCLCFGVVAGEVIRFVYPRYLRWKGRR
jgi:hypothetical protein